MSFEYVFLASYLTFVSSKQEKCVGIRLTLYNRVLGTYF